MQTVEMCVLAVSFSSRKKGVYHKKPNISKSLDDLNEVNIDTQGTQSSELCLTKTFANLQCECLKIF